MNQHFRKIFSNDTIVLDGNEFIDCIFINMRLVFAGGHFDFSNPTFENCTWTLAGGALETARFLKFALMGPGAPPVPPSSGSVLDSDRSARL